MKTPYDPAIRIGRRELDDVRIAINVQLNQLVQIQNERQGVDAAMTREAAAAAGDPIISSYAYLTRMRAERSRLDREGSAAGARLERLRDKAAAAYGSLRAIESAADDYRSEEARAAASAEQARIDDFSGAAYLRARRALPRRRP